MNGELTPVGAGSKEFSSSLKDKILQGVPTVVKKGWFDDIFKHLSSAMERAKSEGNKIAVIFGFTDIAYSLREEKDFLKLYLSELGAHIGDKRVSDVGEIRQLTNEKNIKVVEKKGRSDFSSDLLQSVDDTTGLAIIEEGLLTEVAIPTKYPGVWIWLEGPALANKGNQLRNGLLVDVTGMSDELTSVSGDE